MTKNNLSGSRSAAIFLLANAALIGEVSANYGRSHCPTEREWASTIDPENRPFFLEFSVGAIAAHGPDGYASQGTATVDLFFSLITHAYRDTPEYRDVFSELFLEMNNEPWIRERYGETALLEIAQCMSGDLQIDCAQMALNKGYLKPLDGLIKEPSFTETLQFLKDACQDNEDEIK